jgi:hypothetical protein
MAAAGEEYPEIKYAVTKNGWIEAETFSTYLIRSFIQKRIHPERPALLILIVTLPTVVRELLKMQEKEML